MKSLPAPILTMILLLIGAALSATVVFAEDYPRRINFQNILQNQDIALGEVEAITQDHEGFMWLGGRNALLRYDGFEFLPIPIVDKGKSRTDAPPVKQVADILEDTNHQLWIATRIGLLKYDSDSEVAMHIEGSDEATIFLMGNTVNSLAQVSAGELIVATNVGLFIFDTATQRATKLEHKEGDANSIPDNIIFKVRVDKKGTVWLGCDSGLVAIDWATKKATLYVPDPEHSKSGPDNSVHSIAIDPKGELWLGVDKGLYRFNPTTANFKRYRHDPNDHFSLADDYTRDVYVDKNGWVWIGSDGAGVSLYDATNDRFIRFQYEDGRVGSISSNTIRKIFQDDNSDLWVGTYPSGVNYHDHSTAAITVYKKENNTGRGVLDNNIESIVEDKNGNLWIGGGGVTRYNPDDETFRYYQKGTAHPFNSTSAIGSGTDSDGDIWFGTWANSYQRYNPVTDQFDQMPADATLAKKGLKISDKLVDNVVWSVYEDKQKNLWIGTHNGGLNKYDKKTGTYTVYTSNGEPDCLSSPVVWMSYEDSHGRFWVGTSNGLNLMDREKGTFKHYISHPDNPRQLANSSVLNAFEDHKGRLWFGTDAGLHLYSPETDDFTIYNTQSGFIDSGIRAVVEDQKGNLWLGTNNGFVMFNPDTKVVRNYMRYNGEKIGGIATGAARVTRKGEVVFGTKSGLYIINVNKLATNERVPPVALTDFRLFTQKVPLDGDEKILSKVINRTDSITLDYQKTMLSFHFAALNFRDADKNKFAYKLDGFDDKWREVGNQRSALYTNLDAGNYVFKVKASNNDGIWNETGKSIRVVQLPPPWKTWWAYTLYVLIVIGIIIRFVQSQRAKRRLVEEQNRLLEIKVAERTAELSEKNKDIQAMLSNMRQGLFTLETGGRIHPEYSHFLQDIFETSSIAGEKGVELLFAKSSLGCDTVNQIQQALNTMLGEDEINFSFNAHLLLQEYEATINNHHKFLSLDWNPIVVNDIVSKVMVSVRDVTLLKQMERDAQAKKRELDIISQLLNVSSKKYLSFVTSCKRFVEENREHIEKSEAHSEVVIALLFRNMHTIKGNCRTFGFSYFSDVAHDVESLYSDLKRDPQQEWNRQQLLHDLSRVDSILNEYQHIYMDVLGRGETTAHRDQKGFWADGKAIETIQQCLDAMHRKFPSPKDTQELQPIQGLLNAVLSTPLVDVLADIVESLPSIAVQLHKEAPAVNITDNNIRIKADSCELISNIFAHILRNCVDHGIETPDVRVKAGKPNRGTIYIVAEIENDQLCIRVKDDGQGVNIDRLFKKGVEIGQWKNTDQPSYQTIADLIFASGVSTKEQVTDISGRGVGMDAVKQFLLAQGGNIQLQLKEELLSQLQDGAPLKIPFELIISLPKNTFFAE